MISPAAPASRFAMLRPPEPPPRLADGRRFRYSFGRKPTCVELAPEPHQVTTRDLIISDTITSCQHRPGVRHAPCGARLYIARIQAVGAEILWLAVEVTDEHVRRMHGEPLSFPEKISILGCVLPGVELVLPPERGR